MNQLNLTELKDKLSKGEPKLVDGGYLEDDIRTIYNFYCTEISRPPKIENYFQKFRKFDFIEFLKAYIKDTLGFEVQCIYTHDQWLKIQAYE